MFFDSYLSFFGFGHFSSVFMSPSIPNEISFPCVCCPMFSIRPTHFLHNQSVSCALMNQCPCLNALNGHIDCISFATFIYAIIENWYDVHFATEIPIKLLVLINDNKSHFSIVQLCILYGWYVVLSMWTIHLADMAIWTSTYMYNIAKWILPECTTTSNWRFILEIIQSHFSSTCRAASLWGLFFFKHLIRDAALNACK